MDISQEVVPCATCKGSGHGLVNSCEACGGSGGVRVDSPPVACAQCAGTGSPKGERHQLLFPHCIVCQGTGWAKRRKTRLTKA